MVDPQARSGGTGARVPVVGQQSDQRSRPTPDRPSGDDASRKQRLGTTYARYADQTYADRWRESNPGNRANAEDLDRAARSLLAGWSPPGAPATLLDLGCGRTRRLLAALSEVGEQGTVIGADLLEERLVAARAAGNITPLVCADGMRLPFASGTVDLVAIFTVLSSVPEPTVQQAVASEVVRVLRPGGVVVCYDMRWRSPSNPNVAPVSRARIRRLFPELEPRFRSTTLAPPVARRLGRLVPVLFPLLARIPLMRSHNLWVLTKGPAHIRPV